MVRCLTRRLWSVGGATPAAVLCHTSCESRMLSLVTAPPEVRKRFAGPHVSSMCGFDCQVSCAF
eukprot:5503510-Prymnesium_polylepis.2